MRAPHYCAPTYWNIRCCAGMCIPQFCGCRIRTERTRNENSSVHQHLSRGCCIGAVILLTRGSRVRAGIFFGRVGDAIEVGKPIFATRLRYESVDQSALRNHQGDAITLRTVLRYESGTIHDIAGTLTGTANFELPSADNGGGFSSPPWRRDINSPAGSMYSPPPRLAPASKIAKPCWYKPKSRCSAWMSCR